MNIKLRILLALGLGTVILVAGSGAPAWADRLGAGAYGPAAGPRSDLPAGARPAGTVPTTPTCIRTLVPGRFTVGSIAQWVLENVAGGKLYEACVARPSSLPAELPGEPLAAPILLRAADSTTLGVEQEVCFPVPPGRDGYAYYWDGADWVETDEPGDGVACVTVPATAPSPTYAGLCEETY